MKPGNLALIRDTFLLLFLALNSFTYITEICHGPDKVNFYFGIVMTARRYIQFSFHISDHRLWSDLENVFSFEP